MKIFKSFKIYYCFIIIFFIKCSNKNEYLFEILDYNKTGILFNNKLEFTSEINMIDYMYYYNGSGIGLGDFNNDGLIDIFFASNQQENKLFINKGNLNFEDKSKEAKINIDKSWNTGVSVVDINNDGLLDIYICRVGVFNSMPSNNQLLINKGNINGIPYFEDQAKKYGIDYQGYCTQAAFFDYDLDGDLDLYLLNHAKTNTGGIYPRSIYLNDFNNLTGDQFFENKNGKFFNITKQIGINSSSIGFGLGIALSDINLDGFTDIYIANDFHENDYLYINTKKNSFKDELNKRIKHTSHYSMGVDIADMNNDAFTEIYSVDMLPEDPIMLRSALGEDDYNTFNLRKKYGYTSQYTRNNLQLNIGDGNFFEIGNYSKVAQTDWSWSPLWADFNNDGYKDLFVSNGIPKRLNDIDYVNFISNQEIQKDLQHGIIREKNMNAINNFPEIKLYNKIFINSSKLDFEDNENKIKNNIKTFSNGAAIADLDNDGDLDIVVNNINSNTIIYRNNTFNKKDSLDYIKINLIGNKNNINAIGSKLLVYTNKGIIFNEKFNTHGFESSSETPFCITKKNIKIDSVILIWSDNKYQKIQLENYKNNNITIKYNNNLPYYNYNNFHKNENIFFKNITKNSNINFTHKENEYSDYDIERLLPFKFSEEGPCITIGDINNDGLEDIFIGNSKGFNKHLYIQNINGKFNESIQKDFLVDINFEDNAAIFIDINNDGFKDLVVASGGNENSLESDFLEPRLYLNNKNGKFYKQNNAFNNIRINASCIAAEDLNNDGYLDLFIGARNYPLEFGKMPQSYLLYNNKNNKFIEDTNNLSKEFKNLGYVKNAYWYDIDNDKTKELIFSNDWDGIYYLKKTQNNYSKIKISSLKGFWNDIKFTDINNDGNIDIVATNVGLNNRLNNATQQQPVKYYYNDFDNNKKFETLVTYYLNNIEIPLTVKNEIDKQLPQIKKKYLFANEYSKSTIEELLSKEKINNSISNEAFYFYHTIFINKGNGIFISKKLPEITQLSCLNTIANLDYNNDGYEDILLAGNSNSFNVLIGQIDASQGLLLINNKDENYIPKIIKNIEFDGFIKKIAKININKKQCFIILKNNGKLEVVYN